MFKNIFKRKIAANVPEVTAKPESDDGVFTTDIIPGVDMMLRKQEAMQRTFQKKLKPVPKNFNGGKFALDQSIKHAMDGLQSTSETSLNIMPAGQFCWYASQGFIGSQMCAVLAQHWLIAKACLMPAKDAIRNGYEVTVNDGTELDEKIKDAMRAADRRFNLNANLVQFVHMGRVFGIRIAMFNVKSDDPEYYAKPFNIDGVRPNSYKGITQIDPYWIIPQLDEWAASDAASEYFQVPTWWIVQGRPIHRSHLIIFITEEVPDILKPTYLYGGVPIPQKIYERVYAAERTANEAPMLALTKRTDTIKIDVEAALAQQKKFDERMEAWTRYRDNYGVKLVGLKEEFNRFDTSLTDLDTVIMTQYQIVAAAANVPAVKLLGTTPKGFNATGEYEEASYHEELESIQTHDLTAFLERHYALLIRSEISPNAPFEVTIKWKPLDAMTAEEEANVNKLRAETGATLVNAGVIDGSEERARIISDPGSGYSGLIAEINPNLEERDDVENDVDNENESDE